MSDGDPGDLVEAVRAARDAFDMQVTGRPEFEDGIVRDEDWKTQLQKACRLLEACRVLRTHDGYHTSVIEMSFAAIERTLEFYCLYRSEDAIDDFADHERVYDRVVELGLYTCETADELRYLYAGNRTNQYYGNIVSTRQQAESMHELARIVHRETIQPTGVAYKCNCPD